MHGLDMHGLDMDFGRLVPEIALLAAAVIALVGGSFLARDRQRWTVVVALAGLATAAVAGALQALEPARTVFDGSYALDAGTGALRVLLPVATAAVLLLGRDELRGTARESETVALLLLAALGALVLGDAHDLLVLAAGFLLASIPLYGLIGIRRDALAAEATVKTYLQGALAGVVMLGGVAVLAGVGGATEYGGLLRSLRAAPPAAVAIGAVAVAVGLLFEAGSVPAHFWVPDATQAAGRAVAAFLTTVPKLAAVLALLRLESVVAARVDLALVIGVVAGAGMVVGTLAALPQQDVRRLLGWSAVAQVGFLLMAVASPGASAAHALLTYLAAYTVSNLAAFAVIAALPQRRRVGQWAGVARAHPWLTGALLVALLSLVGTPPTAVFLGKLAVLTAAWTAGAGWLAVVAVLASVASLAYSIRWIAACFADPEAEGAPGEAPRQAAAVAPRIPAAVAIALAVATLVFAAALPLLQAPSLVP